MIVESGNYEDFNWANRREKEGLGCGKTWQKQNLWPEMIRLNLSGVGEGGRSVRL